MMSDRRFHSYMQPDKLSNRGVIHSILRPANASKGSKYNKLSLGKIKIYDSRFEKTSFLAIVCELKKKYIMQQANNILHNKHTSECFVEDGFATESPMDFIGFEIATTSTLLHILGTLNWRMQEEKKPPNQKFKAAPS